MEEESSRGHYRLLLVRSRPALRAGASADQGHMIACQDQAGEQTTDSRDTDAAIPAGGWFVGAPSACSQVCCVTVATACGSVAHQAAFLPHHNTSD